jgi:hypothetical protein
MDQRLIKIFQLQIALQCKFLLRACEDVNRSLANNDIDGVFYGLQNLLGAGANITKALWGQGMKLETQRAPLRESLNVTDDSPLKNVKVRNYFEHFDEKLDDWWRKSERRNYADKIIGSSNAISGLEQVEKFRFFDPLTTDLNILGQEINVQALANEARVILSVIEKSSRSRRTPKI